MSHPIRYCLENPLSSWAMYIEKWVTRATPPLCLLSAILLAFQTDTRRVPSALQQPDRPKLLPDLGGRTSGTLTTSSPPSTQPPQAYHNQPPQQTSATSPWIPIPFDAKGIEQMERAINFSVACKPACRAKTFQCSKLEVPRCYGKDCTCSNGFLLPIESQKALPFASHGRFAVVLAGLTRSFFSELMNEFWRLFLARFNGDLVLFAVLTTSSLQKLHRSGLPPQRKDQVA